MLARIVQNASSLYRTLSNTAEGRPCASSEDQDLVRYVTTYFSSYRCLSSTIILTLFAAVNYNYSFFTDKTDVISSFLVRTRLFFMRG